MANRAEAGLPLQAQIAARHSVDTYGKHRLKLKSFYSSKFRAHCLRVAAATPRGDAMIAHTDANAGCPTEITGEPMHDHFSLRALVSPAANDCNHIVSDHKDCILRLSAKLAPPFDATGVAEAANLQSREAELLLHAAVTKRFPEVKQMKLADRDAAAAVKTFMQQAGVQKAATWKQLFKAEPPRGVLVRMARIFDTKLHSSLGIYNYKDERAAFRQETRRIIRWYRPGRRQTRWRRGIVRDHRSSPQVAGTRSASTRKVRAHFRRLRKPLRVEGFMQCRKVALALHEANMPMQSGTVAVERLWSQLQSMLPSAATRLSPRWFRVLAMLMFVRYNFNHFRNTLPGVVDRDSLMAQRLNTLEMLTQAASDSCHELEHLSLIFDAFLDR